MTIVCLRRVTMTAPSAGMYTLGEEMKEIDLDDFTANYLASNELIQIQINGITLKTIAYANGLDCWWIVDSIKKSD